MDILFDYDLREMKAKIQKTIHDAQEYFFDDTEKYAEAMKDALREYPGNEALLCALLDAYEYSLRAKNDTSHLDEMIELSQKLISECSDFILVYRAKDTQAAAYLQKGEYEKAKTILETLPRNFNLRDNAFAFRLAGRDKLDGSVFSRNYHLEGLYIACMREGDAWFRMHECKVTFRDYTAEDYIPQAMRCYQKGLQVLTAFILDDIYRDPSDQYLWAGMQTFHWIFHQRIAACYKRLGKIEECEKSIAEAYRLVSAGWKDFEENKTHYMTPFHQYLADFDLSEYIR